MNYSRIYEQIILKSKSEARAKGGAIYYENHHIIPKCLGGNNSKDNLVLLTAREHFISHHLLVKMYPSNRKLIHAFWYMCNIKNVHQQNRYIPSLSIYQEARELNASVGISIETRQKMSRAHTDSNHTFDTKAKIAKSNSKPKDRTVCIYCNKNISIGTNSKRWHFDNCKNKMGNEHVKRKSPNTEIIVKCTHCNIVGGVNIMHRWHFDNCKNKINLVTTK
jgi:hypothetical protein